MKNISILFFLWAGLFCGCTQTEVVGEGSRGKQETVEASFRLNILTTTTPVTRSAIFTSDGTAEGDSLLTRSTTDPGDAADKALFNLWVGQYNSTGILVVEDYFNSLATQESVNLPLKRIEGTSKVWIVANAGNLQGKADTETALKALSSSDAFTEEGLPVNSLCVMAGSWSGMVTDNIDASVTLKRTLAKIIFTYSVGGTNFSFTPTSLELCDVPVLMKYLEETTPVQLSGDENYKTYTVTNPGTSGTHYWYLPENPAGEGSNIDGEAIGKTGAGVTHATCIRLTGDAKQDDVEYGNVVFTLYPGAGNNDYTIVRNGLYRIEIKLGGIDFSDKRVTVGTVPEMQDPENLAAEKGATGIFQVTTRPGVEWSFTIPTWLSAVIGETTYESGNKLDFVGPYKVEFKAVTANPQAEVRETSFKVGEKDIYVRQNASSLSVGSSSISLNAEGSSTGTSAFKATRGLPWAATLTSEWGSWLEWDGETFVPGAEATGEDEALVVKTSSSNPSSSDRTGTILLKGGDAVSNAGYQGLTGSISVVQKGATIAVTTPTRKVGPEATKLSDSFVATHSLPWVATVTSETDWLSLSAPQNGTTGTISQTINYETTLNLHASERKGNITIRVGNEADDSHPGPLANITVTQEGSVFEVTVPVSNIPATGGSVSGVVTATSGLPWTVTPQTNNGITVSPAAGSGNGALTFSANENKDVAVSANFVVRVNDTERSQTLTVNQASTYGVVAINQTVADAYKAWLAVLNATDSYKSKTLANYPPFNYDNGNYSSDTSSDRKGTSSSSCTITTPYEIEIERTQSQDTYNYDNNGAAYNYCQNKNNNSEGWRVPTNIELFAIWQECKGTNSDASDDEGASGKFGDKFIADFYWCSSVYGGLKGGWRSVINLKKGEISFARSEKANDYVRCVRDKIN